MIGLTSILQLLVNGIILGSLLAVIGVAFSLVFGTTKIINFAHGDFIALASFIAFSLFISSKVDPLISLLISLSVLAVVLFVIFLFVSPLLKREKFDFDILLATVAVSLIYENTFVLLRGEVFLSVPTVTLAYGKSLALRGVYIPGAGLVGAVLAIVTVVAVHVFLTRTHTGKVIRAVADNDVLASLCSILPNRAYGIAFAISGVTAAVAGTIYAMLYVVDPLNALVITVQGFVVMSFSGTGKVYGVLVGGIIFGLILTFGQYFLGSQAGTLIWYAIFLLVLVLKPQGLFREAGVKV